MGQSVGRPEVGEVENLVASLRPSVPELSVTLQWDVPRESREDEITAYDICFRPRDEEVYSNETSVDGAFKTITFTSTSGIVPLTTYEFGVRARIGDAVGNWKTVIVSVPGPVENIKTVVDPKHASVRLSWDPPLNFKTPGEGTTYRIRFKPEGRSNYDKETVTTNCVSLTRNSGLKSSKMHTFEVRAENAEAAGDWKIFSVYIDLVPDPVQSLSAAVNKDIPSVTLSWEPPGNVQGVEEVTEYHIRFKPFRDKGYIETTAIGTATSIVLTRGSGLVPLKNYLFQVRAQSGYCKGEWKEVTSFCTLKPGEVQNLRSTLNTSEPSLILNWDQPNNVITAGDVTAYDIRFEASGIAGGNSCYSMMTVNEPARSILLTRESGLKPLTNYTLEVRARNFHCKGEWKCISQYIALHPGSVRNLSVTVEENVTLSWNPPINIQNAEEVSEYQIRFKTVGSECYNEMTVRDSCTATIEFTQESGLVSLKNYEFEVRAQSDCGEGEWEKVSAFCALVPGQVQNLRSTLDPDIPTLTLHWDKPKNMNTDGDVKSYDIRFKPCGSEGNYCKETVVAPATSVILTRDSGLKPMTKYKFEVQARSTSQEGKWNELSEYFDLHPDPVRNLSVTVDESVTLSWNPPANVQCAEEVSEYRIRFKPHGGEHYNEMTVRDSCTATIVFTQESGLVSSKNYKFEVTAQNHCGAGEWLEASAFCALVPGQVQNLRSTLDTITPSLTLTWDKPTNMVTDGDVVSYRIRFKPTGSGWEGNYCEKKINAPATSIVLTRKSGLKPMTKYDFEIRAQSLYHEGKWMKHSKYITLVPGDVQNLRSVLDTSRPSLTLNWDRPNNTQSTEDVGTYDIRFRPSGSVREDAYCMMTVNAPTTSIVLTREDGLKTLTKYDFEVRAHNDDHEGEWSTVSEYIALVPGQVHNLRSTLDANVPTLTLNWDKPSNCLTAEEVTAYDIRLRPTENWCEKGYHNMTVDSSVASVLLTRENGLNPQIRYDFEIRARNDHTEGEWSKISKYLDLIPDPVQSLSAAVNEDTPSVTLSWRPPGNIQDVEELTGYHIRFKPFGGKEYVETTVTSSTSSIVLSRESGLVPLKNYNLQVCAQSGCYTGEWKEATAFCALKPGEVQNLRSTLNPIEASLTLNWDQPINTTTAGDVTAYDIRFKMYEGNNYYSVMAVNAPARSIHLTRESGLKPLTKYTIEVRARNFHCQGEWSCISEYIALHPDPVRNLSVTIDENVTLSWNPPANIQNAEEVSEYQIRFKPDGRERYNQMMVKDSCTASIDFTQDSDLVSSIIYNFEVRAQNECGEGEWEKMSAFCALVPGQVQNLRSTLDPDIPTLTLHWDKPINMTTDGDVKSYDIRFKPYGSEGNYCKETVVAPATSILLTRDSGLKPLTKYKFDVRARSVSQEGKWSELSEYIDLHPDPVKNFSVTVDENVTLSWNPPANIQCGEEVSEYQLRCFKPDGSVCYNQMTIKDSCTATIDFTQESRLVSSNSYKFEVRAQNHCGEGEWVEASAFCALIPGHVQNLRSTLDTNTPSLTLIWEKPNNMVTNGDLVSYHIRFKPRSGWEGNYCEKKVNPPATNIVLTRKSGLKPMTNYDFEVRAQSSHHEGKWTKISKYISLVPGEVQNLRSVLDTSRPSLTLNWDRPNNTQSTEDVGAYNIRFRPSGSVREDTYCTMTVNAPTTSIVLTREDGLKTLTKYDFEVRAHNDDHEGEWSTVSEYIALVPGQVQNLRSTLDPDILTLTLNWDKPSNVTTAEEVTAYDIRFRPTGSLLRKGYHMVTVDYPATSILLTRENGLNSLTRYDFEVRAWNANCEGEWSQVSKYIALTPDLVQNLTAAVDTCKPSVTLNWDPPANAGYAGYVTKYEIHFDNDSGFHGERFVNGSTTTTVITRKSGLRPLSTFTFKVRAYSGGNASQEWVTESRFIALTPDPVQNLTAVVDTHTPSVTLNWKPPANAAYKGLVTKYEIHFNSDNGFHGEEFVNGSTTTTVITRESGLRPLTTFTFEVRAYSGDDVSGEWRTVSTFVALVPGQVQNLKSALDPSVPSLTLNWDKPSNVKTAEEVTAYDIRFRPARSLLRKGYHMVTVDSPAASALLTRENGLNPQTRYDFEVRAWNADHCEGKWSKVSKYIALTPGPIQNLIAAVDTHKLSVTLNWDPPANAAHAEDVTKYEIRFWDNDSSFYDERVVNGSTTTTVITRESGLTPLSTYTFKVRAYSGGNASQEWTTESRFIALTPDPVENLTAVVDTHDPSVTLNWDPPANAAHAGYVTKYEIHFQNHDSGFHGEKTVNGSTTTTVITRESGLRALSTFTFKVRAYSGDDASQKWKTVSTFVALTPDPVQNLTAVVDTHTPSVTLNWNPPANAAYAGYVTKYEVHFNNDISFHGEKFVNGSTTTTVITRESGLRPLSTFTFKVRAYSGDDVSREWRTVSRFVALVPGQVQNLRSTLDTNIPSLTLNWDKPSNVKTAVEVKTYDIHFRPAGSSLRKTQVTVDSPTTCVHLTRENGLNPLTMYEFEVRAQNDQCEGEWSKVSIYIGAPVPGPVQNLRFTLDTHSLRLNWDKPSNAKTSGNVTAYDIRFRQSRSLVGDGYSKMTVNASTTSVLLTEASGYQPLKMYDLEVRARNGGHEGQWSKVISTGLGVVKLDHRSQEYTTLCEKFRRDWAKRKGPCPSIVSIAKIINPVVSQRFESYRHTSWRFNVIEQHYHGTRLCCDLANSAELCDGPNCGICGITRKGFDPQKISRSSFQRFGEGFYFAPNSSKAYDYATGNRFGAAVGILRNTCYSSVLLCDIAPGRKYTLQFRDPLLSKPPPGYDSFYGENRAVTGRGELNYDELVVFDHQAIHPRYIIFCQK